MKKVGALILLLVISSSLFIPSVKAGTYYSKLSTVGLKLGGAIKFGDYEVQFRDVSSDWSSVRIDLYQGGERVAYFLLKEGEEGYYPSKDNPKLIIKVSGIWEDRGVVYITLSTPMKVLEDNLVLSEGKSYTLPSLFPRYKFTVVDIPADNEVKMKVTYPDGSSVYKILDKDSPISVGYKVSSDLTQSPVVVVELVKATKNDEAVVNIYVPELFFTNPQIINPGEEEQTVQVNETEIVQLVYDGLLYKGETLTLEYNATTYKLNLVSVGYYSSFKLLDSKGKTLESFTIREGTGYTCTKAPIRVEIPPNGVDLAYNRTYVKVYTPVGGFAKPIIREAKVVAELSVNQKSLLLGGDELIVFIKVKNLGKGNAFRVKVIAPVPNNFELRSGIGAWVLSRLEPFSEMPVLVYTLKPKAVGTYTLGPVIVEYYDEAGRKVTIKSNVIEKINVYALPKVTVKVLGLSNSTWSTFVKTQANSTIKLRFEVSATGNNPKYEFIKNATLLVNLGDFLDGKDKIPIGIIKGGEEKVIDGQYLVLKEGAYPLSVSLKYQDPLGNWHTVEYPNVLLIDSIPPKVKVLVKTETKVVEKTPKAEELPGLVESLLKQQSNPTPLAMKIQNITSKFLPPQHETNYKLIATILGILAVVFGTVAVGTGYYMVKYREELRKLKAKKKRPRPGGLPKKPEDKEEVGEIKVLQ
ncbi:hypothetical protein A3L04_07235 [Thermococcus chitonophagus]|uniref:DNA cytosine methyltransferase n=1 Tax=Thermococcus chitonophagus TaxID=54262 RepID=A0A160VWL8_9EURY|nr:hypothetical protein [Thermococcus chitonophagus]ASJ16881.1 hypothetical protein A3L04_07235 [Thermococcus chitonophagus]CUX78361.1 hypothetical protein CHITON_1582 [Thermococcus chitonophagus]